MQAIARSDIQVPSKRSRSVQARPHGTAGTHAARHAVAAHCDVFGARFGCGDYGGAVDDCQGLMPAQKLEPRTIFVELLALRRRSEAAAVGMSGGVVLSAGETARMAGAAGRGCGRLFVRRGLRCCCVASCGLCRVPANAGASALSEGAARTRARRRSRTNGRDQPLPACRDTQRERVRAGSGSRTHPRPAAVLPSCQWSVLGPAQARGLVSDANAARGVGLRHVRLPGQRTVPDTSATSRLRRRGDRDCRPGPLTA